MFADAAGAGQDDPLKVLEELLEESGVAKDGDAGDGEPQLSEEEQLEVVRQMEEKQAVEDAERLKAERQRLEQIKESPEYQARVEQQEEEAEQKQEQAAFHKGHEIRQLGHSKIEVPAEEV